MLKGEVQGHLEGPGQLQQLMGNWTSPDPTSPLETCFLPTSVPHLLVLLTMDLAIIHSTGALEWQGSS